MSFLWSKKIYRNVSALVKFSNFDFEFRFRWNWNVLREAEDAAVDKNLKFKKWIEKWNLKMD